MPRPVLQLEARISRRVAGDLERRGHKVQHTPRSYDQFAGVVAAIRTGGWVSARQQVKFQALALVNAVGPGYVDGQPAGAQLALALASGRQYNVLAYVDEKRWLQGTLMNGVPVIGPMDLDRKSTRLNSSHRT